MHALDCQAQMWLTKVTGNGQGSLSLDASPPMAETDKYMRWLDRAGNAANICSGASLRITKPG